MASSQDFEDASHTLSFKFRLSDALSFGRSPWLWMGVWLSAFASFTSAGQGAGRMLYAAPNTTFVSQRTGETLVTINDVSGSITALQTAINNARVANPTNVIVIRLLKGATYSVSNASLTLGFKQCLVAEGATIQA